MIENLLDLLTEESSLKIVIASIISIVSILFVVIRVFFKVWNKTSFEKMLTPKYEAVWEGFLELIFTSLIFTFGLFSAGYGIGVRFNFLNNECVLILLLIAWVIIMIVFMALGIILLIPQAKSFIKRGYKLKKIIKCSLLLSYLGVIFTIIIMVSLYVNSALEENISLQNQLLNMILYGIINIILFTVVVILVRHVNRELHLFNIQRDIYKVSKININELNNLYFVYAMKEDIHILQKSIDLNDNDLSVIFLYYVKEDILLKYQKQTAKTTEKV